MTSRLFFNLLFSLSLSGTLLFGCWLVGHVFLRNKLSKRFAYYLLLIVVARLLVPVTAVKSFMHLVYTYLSTTPLYVRIFGPPLSSHSNSPIIIGENVVIGDNVVLGTANPYGNYLFIIWFVVFFFLLVQKTTKYQSFTKYIRSGWVAVDTPATLDLLSRICEEKNISRVIELYTTPLVSSPLLFGLRRSYIVLPDEHLSEAELYSILLHEVTHYKQKDLLYKWLVQVTIAIHWFNPIVYYLEKVVNTACEYACDETAISALTAQQRYDYGTTLIAMTKRTGTYNERVASVTLYESTQQIKKRLIAIGDYKPQQAHGTLPVYLLTFLFALLAFYLGAYYQ